jgi:hypothetical protein
MVFNATLGILMQTQQRLYQLMKAFHETLE